MHSRVAQLITALAIATCKVNATQQTLNLNANIERAESSQCTAKPNKPSNWGHVHALGSIEPIEFFTALFSDEFPCEPLNIVIGEPADGCAEMQNQVAGAAVLVHRGECPFSEKADNIAKAGGRAMILANTIENSLFGMPNSNMTAEERKSSLHDKIASVMIRERSAGLLKHLIHASSNAKVLLNGEFASDSAGRRIEDCGTCKAGLDGMAEMSSEEEALFKSKIQGGRVFASFSNEKLLQDEIVFSNEDEGMELDFFVGYTGSSIPVHTTGTLAVLDDTNRYACEPINEVYPKGTVLLVERGECVFSEKFKNAYMAGVWVVLIINSDNELVLPGFPEAEMEKNSISFNPGTLVAGPTVFHKSGLRLKQMVKEASQPVFVTFRPTDVTVSDAKSLDAIDKLAISTKSDILDLQEITTQLGLDAEAVNKLNSMP